jgi:hypothetical protein
MLPHEEWPTSEWIESLVDPAPPAAISYRLYPPSVEPTWPKLVAPTRGAP